MAELYFMSKPTNIHRGRIRMNYKGPLAWAFLEWCEDGFTFLSKPFVLVVRLQDNNKITQKIRVIRFRKQENLNAWVSQHLQGLREEGYDVSYMD
jgi:hypothetical protein